ncbi:MAG: branched-chain amino acid ABC transporter substrate-binding protein [Rhodocyclaceae bacterium]|nr:branched-chain amino acid ABC transporter substrate-binding protein [Rhodocyclaceae bacterium]
MHRCLLAMLLAVYGAAPAKADDLVVRIGSAAPLSGSIAHLGRGNANGVRLALEDANALGVRIGGKPVRFELLSEDDGANPRTGVTVAKRLIAAGVSGVVGHLNSGTTLPASRLYASAGVPMISPSATSVELTGKGLSGIFRTIANDTRQGAVLGHFVVDTLGGRRVAIVDDHTPYGRGLADEAARAVQAAGGEIVARESTTDRATDFTGLLTRVRATRPDVVMFGGMDAQGGPMLHQVRQLGIDAIFVTGDGGCSREFLRLAGDDSDDALYCTMSGVPLDAMPGGPDFRDRFEARFGDPVQLYSPYAYDAAMALVHAIRRAGSSDPVRFLPVLRSNVFQGVTGNIAFDASGDVKEGAITVYRHENGRWVAQ